MSAERFAFLVKQRALQLGFDAVGITDLGPVPHRESLDRWLAQGMAGTMTYMHRQAERRKEPAQIAPEARRAIVVAKNYYRHDPPPPPPARACGRVAKYARGRDYHAALKAPLEQLAEYARSLGPSGTLSRAYVDAGPVPERELAQRAGLGWIGKSTMLIDPQRGSFLFLGTVLTSLDLAVDPPFEADRCGTCRRCLDACPTEAFPDERVLDSRRCISYLTIEHPGDIDPALAPKLGNWVFGCDVCQDVCPWNVSFARQSGDTLLEQDDALAYLNLTDIAALSDREFDRRFGWTALERTGAAGLRRNARIALKNRNRESPCPTP
ncbi:MAG: tRNA epoxyqueuosine(34) reductase QueG [Gemmatimonadetes bacterium]|nr:tRNA epoxyqueuosine(34) reductase QueG [Gemmatimonadota bacterium]